jgi:hypothetical protein
MRLPGFTAEASLRPAGDPYRSHVSQFNATSRARVVPQQYPCEVWCDEYGNCGTPVCYPRGRLLQ